MCSKPPFRKKNGLPVSSCFLVLCLFVPSIGWSQPVQDQSAVTVQGPTEGNLPGAPAVNSTSGGGVTGAGMVTNQPFAGHLLGDAAGLRSLLAEPGVSIGLSEQSEVFGNVTGGYRRAADYEGVTSLGLGIDAEKAFGIAGGTINVTAFDFHGRGPTSGNIPALGFLSSVEQSSRGAELFEFWYEQVLLNKKLAVRVGQMSADQEFIVSQYGSLFLNSGYGFPTLAADDLPSGGPAYPLATPGVRVKFVPSETIAALMAVFNGNPAGAGVGDPQKRDASGTAFRLNDGTFTIAEVQYGINQEDNAPGLAGTYKIGGWYNSLSFADQRFSYTGQSLGNPSNTMAALLHHGDYSVYAVADQFVWKKPGTKDGGVGVFARIMAAPPDRNLIDSFVQAGISYRAPFTGRDNDTIGLATSWAHISSKAAKLDSDRAKFAGQPIPIRRSEIQIEFTYQAQLAAWLQIQPDFQYLIQPGGGVLDSGTGRRSGNAAVLGTRAIVTF